MATAYFCNGVTETININLNNELTGTSLKPRATQPDACTNSLPMHAVPVAKTSDKGTFNKNKANTVVIRFGTLKEESNTFNIEVDDSVAEQDLYFYVFENTLVGQDQAGRSTGVSIQVHETIRRLVQSGNEAPVMRLKITPPRTEEENR